MTAPELLGHLASAAGILDRDVPISARELAAEFCWSKLKGDAIYLNEL
jgi:hypothetical protein